MQMQSTSPKYFLSWIVASAFYAFQMTLRVMPIVITSHLSNQFGFSANSLGLLAGTYYIGYCIAHIPVGIGLDRFEPRYVIAFCIFICILGLYANINATSRFEIFLGRFLIGFGSSCGILGSIKVISDFYSKSFGLMLGLTISIGVIGAYYGSAPIRILLARLSGEQLLEAFVLCSLMIGGMIIAFYSRSKPQNPDSEESQTQKEKIPATHMVLKAFSNKKLIYTAIFSGLMVGPLSGFADFWGINYLSQIHELSNTEAIEAITVLFIGLGVGCPLLGYFEKYIALSPRAIAYIGIIMVLTLVTLLFVEKLPSTLIYFLCFIIGISSSYQILSFTIIHKSKVTGSMSISMAILNMIIMIFGFIYHGLIGFILNTFFIPAGLDSLIYGPDAYQAAFSVILIGISIGIMGFWNMKD